MHKQMIAPEPFDLYTGGKQAELAIAFNLAYDNVEKYINTLMDWSAAMPALTLTDQLDERAFVYLREYLWKGNSENKNSSGYALDLADKSIILQLLKKLPELRNFHSHYWHDNSIVRFDDELRLFIQDKHDRACGKLLEVKSIDAELYCKQQDRYPLFKNSHYITQEGRVFLLSFFLNKGQMQHLLQRRKGSKRHDLPEYKFKHKVFTFYCHREGAASLSMGTGNDMLPTMEEAGRKRIYDGRQANRILSYLKDRPAFSGKEPMPLVLASGHWVADMGSLVAFTTENNILPGFHFYERAPYPGGERADEKEANKENKQEERMEREGYRRFILPGNEAYAFEISYGVLRRIVTEIWLDENDPGPSESPFSSRDHFIGVLKDCIATRKYIYESLKGAGEWPINPESYALKKMYSSIYIDYSQHEGAIQERYYTGNEWRMIPISPTLRVEKLLIGWHDSFLMSRENEATRRMKLLNAIRPKTAAAETPVQPGARRNGRRGPSASAGDPDPEPLLFHLAYYFREQKTNMRMEDRFLEWGVRYLMDMGLVPDWHFEMERLVYAPKFNQPESPYKLKKELRWEQEIPDNYRLYITDNQLNIGIRRGDRFHRLRIGKRVLKYLLHWHFHTPDKKGKSINDFLLAVTGDLSLFQESPERVDVGRLKLLEAFAIPELYFKTKARRTTGDIKTSVTYKDQARQFFHNKTRWIDEQLATLKKYTRSQKNTVLLDAYRLFDFSGTEGSKFLRKNEYEQMSICHYMLNQDPGKVRNLIERTFRLRMRLPAEILQLVYAVAGEEDGNLDELCIRVLRNRRAFLQGRLSLLQIDGLKPRQLRREVTGSLAIYFDDGNLTEEELNLRQTARTDSLSHLPFAVHPALTLKYFYPEEFAVQGFCKEGGEYRNIFLSLRRNKVLSGALREENYREAAYRKVLGDYTARFPGDTGFERWLDKWVGHMNDRKVKEILLLQIAGRYLEKYDPHSAEEFRRVRQLKKLNLEQLFSTPAVIQLKYDQGVSQGMDATHRGMIPRVICLQLRLHQFDDYFYRSQRSNLSRLAISYLIWRAEELERYRDHPEISQQLELWPDGSDKYPLTVGSLIEAGKTSADQAAELIKYLFDYEAGVLNGHFPTMDKQQKQAALLQYSGQEEKGVYISFPSILRWDGETSSEVKERIEGLRNSCLHNLIPVNGSYRQQSLPGSELAEALGIFMPLGKDRTEKNIYEIYEENEHLKG